MKSQNILTTAGAMLVAIGGMCYLLFRPTNLLIYRLACLVGLENIVEECRCHALQWDIPGWMVYALPDGLWSAGYILVVEGLFRPHPCKWLVAGIIPVIGVLSEALQAAGIMTGTFDVADMVCYLLPYAVYLILKFINIK